MALAREREQLLEAVGRGDHRGPGVEREAGPGRRRRARPARRAPRTARCAAPAACRRIAAASPPKPLPITAIRASAIRRLQPSNLRRQQRELGAIADAGRAGRRARRADSWTPAAAPCGPTAMRSWPPAPGARVPSPSSASASATALACSSANAAASSAGSTAASAHGQVGAPLRRSSSAFESPVSGGGAVRLPKSSSICRPRPSLRPNRASASTRGAARLRRHGAQQRGQLHQRRPSSASCWSRRCGTSTARGMRPAGADRSSACPRWQ